MRSGPSTVGVKPTPTPNCLYSTVIEPKAPPCATGIGTSPPTRKLAVSATPSDQLRLREDLAQPLLVEDVQEDVEGLECAEAREATSKVDGLGDAERCRRPGAT